jgi:fucose 4-O-acetylase-like acetyltransferase
MPKATIFFGVLLILLGLVGYLGTGHQHPTALIPLYFGAALAICGGLAHTADARRRMMVMHVAVTIALLGFLGTITGVVEFIRMEAGHYTPYPAAAESKAAMCLICLFYVLLAVRSFIAARRGRITL